MIKNIKLVALSLLVTISAIGQVNKLADGAENKQLFDFDCKFALGDAAENSAVDFNDSK